MLDKILQKLGLSSKEARVYLAALELGAASVQQIAKKASVNRPTTYVILGSLMKKGLATSVERGKKVLFTAEPPEQLERLLARQQDEIEEKRQDLLKILPELEAIFNLSENRPKVKFYEGMTGISSSEDDFYRSLERNDRVYSFSPLDEMVRLFPNAMVNQPKLRLKMNVWAHIIYTNSKGPVRNATSNKEKRVARFIPSDKFPIKSLISILPNKRVQITNLTDKLSAVLIEDPTIANAFKVVWDLAWESAEKYDLLSSRTK